MSALLGPYRTLPIPGEEITWAGECPWTGMLCFGTESGRLVFPTGGLWGKPRRAFCISRYTGACSPGCCATGPRATPSTGSARCGRFQWRIAVSWLCSYFTVQVFIPILFALRGPIEAGQMGMSLSIAGYMTDWCGRGPRPRRRLWAADRPAAFLDLDGCFGARSGRSLAAFAAMALPSARAALCLAVAPRLAARMVAPQSVCPAGCGRRRQLCVQCLATCCAPSSGNPSSSSR